MTSVTAFNDMMGQFLMELHKTFPEEKGLKKYIAAFELMRSANGKMIVDGFMENVAPHVDKINSKDESFFLEHAENIDFLKDINLKNCWPKASTGTKNAIWQYLQTLIILGTTITSIDADTLGAIEGIAEKMAKGSGDGVPDLSALQGLMGTLGNMKM